jgi:hypothetical protein
VSTPTFQPTEQHTPPGPIAPGPRERRYGGARIMLIAFGGALVVVVVAFAVLAFAASDPSLSSRGEALTHVNLPLTGGKIVSVSAVGPHERPVPLVVEGNSLYPKGQLSTGEHLSIEVRLRRSGWIGWLAGSEVTKRLSVVTPSANVRERYVTLATGSPLTLHFDQPVARVAFGAPEHLHHHTLSAAQSSLTLAHSGEAGSIEVAAVPRRWERLPAPTVVSWFPAGVGASAVLSPRPGTRISSGTPIVLSFSQPVSQALGGVQPRLSPAAEGSWHTIGDHAIEFRPRGFGYGLDTQVTIGLPHNVRLIGGRRQGSSSTASWTVPSGTTLRAQQILAELGYLPLTFTSSTPVAGTATAQEAAAIDPPQGSFGWRYSNTPASLRSMWAQGSYGEVTKAAVMMFESQHEMTTDGLLGPEVWRTLIGADIAHRTNTFGYTYVSVSEAAQHLSLWHDGSVRLTTPVNTGIASAPTALGTFAVYEHIASGTMSGTNPDGSHYEDPGVPWISYFNGGDALHGFERAQYGFPQSLGCVEMLPATAGRVWPYTPIGTLVNIT